MRPPLRLALLLATTLLLNTSFSQSTCGSDALWQRQRQQDQLARHRERTVNEHVRTHIDQERAGQRGGGGPLIIPVVVHIVHNNGPENISDAQVQQGLAHLNQAFANSGAYAVPSGVDIGIQFCLAQQDTSGMPTTGITRTESSLTDMISETQDAQLKALVRWDPTRYLNIWLVNTITSASTGPSVAGYAYFPSSHGAPEDGIVNEAGLFGSSVDNSKVHVHEAGHYLGLYHTFEGGCSNANCMTQGDRVCDTPPDASTQAVLCGATANTCTTDADDTSLNNPFRPVAMGGLGDQNDLYQDYMDYGLQQCQDRYTAGQSERMRAALTTARASLLASPACNTGCGISILNIGLPNDAQLIFGTSMLMVPTTIGATTVSYSWQVDGSTVSTSPTYNADQLPLGDHTVTLVLTNTAAGCSVEQSIAVHVRCSVPLAWNRMPLHPEPGQTVTFSTWLEPGITAQWFADGVAFGSGAIVTTVFPQAGYHSVYAVTSNGGCTDTTQSTGFLVGSCPSAYDRNWQVNGPSCVSFLTDPPTVSFVPSEPAFNHNEGTATLSDAHGEVIIYTNGVNVWDRTRNMMQNGDSLMGGLSSSQSSLIVADPSDNGLHYLFTTDHFAGFMDPPSHGSLRYSVIDLALNNGLGAVTQKNMLLMERTTEKLTAVKHCNGHDIWVVAHEFGTDAFHSWLITDDGMAATPLVQHVGKVHAPFTDWGPGYEGYTAIGTMRFSQQGDKLALASTKGAGFAQVFNFDAETGAITDPITIRNAWDSAYFGVEFSPDGRNLYLSTEGGIVNGTFTAGKICQHHLVPYDSTAITNSSVPVAYWLPGFGVPTLILAPNDKIYVGINGGFHAMNNPNGLNGDCGFNYNDAFQVPGLSLGVNNTVVRNRPAERISASGPTYVCNYTTGVEYTMDRCVHAANTSWRYNGPNTVVSETPDRIVLDFHVAGTDTLFAVRDNGCEGLYMDTLVIQVDLQLPLIGPDTAYCAPVHTVLTADEGYASYLWQNNSSGHTLEVNASGTYWLKVTALGGCSITDTVVVSAFPNDLVLDLGPDRTACYGNMDPIVAPTGFASYSWSTGSTTNSTLPYNPFVTETFTLQVTDADGCVANDALTVTRQYDGPYFDLGPDLEICPGEVLTLTPEVLFGDASVWHWYDNSDLPTHTVWQPGHYWVTATSACGWSLTDSITVTECSLPTAVLQQTDPGNIRLAPNPTADLVTILLPTRTTLLRAEVMDMLGKVVWRANGAERTFSMRTLAPGVYMVRLSTNGGHWLGRVVKE